MLAGYLKNHDDLNTESMTLIVRQLSPTSEGVPLEIYTFTNTIDWVEYEGIQSDIFDHIFAVLPKFGLRAFQGGTCLLYTSPSPRDATLSRIPASA